MNALNVAKKNAENNKIESWRVKWIESDWLSQVPEETFDLIVSNPPYVSRSEFQSLNSTITKYLICLQFAIDNSILVDGNPN